MARKPWTHGRSAYVRELCRCKEICTPEHAKARKQERAEGRQKVSGGPRTWTFEQYSDTSLGVSSRQYRIVQEWLKDGADAETVARRIGVRRHTVNNNLFAIQTALGFDNRVELALAIERGQSSIRIRS